MLEGPVAFGPFEGLGEVELRAQPEWEALHDGAGDLWPPEARDGNSDNLGVVADAQITYSSHTATAKFNRAIFDGFQTTHLLGIHMLEKRLSFPVGIGHAGIIKVLSAYFFTSPRMFKAATDAAGVAYAPTAHRSLLFPSFCTHEDVFVCTMQEL
jgi:hypothetical protein